MHVVHIAAECAPVAATGGLAEVVRALPGAQHEPAAGRTARVIIPGYRIALRRLREAGTAVERTGAPLGVSLHDRNWRFDALRARADGPELRLLACPPLFDRDSLYGEPVAFEDNPLRFSAFCHAALALIRRGDLGPVDIVHAHDWHAAPAVVLAAGEPDLRTVLTVHNLAHQGNFDAAWLPRMGLPADSFHLEGLEYYGRINLLKGAIAYCDAFTTVSPTYALEIMTPLGGDGLDGVIRAGAGKLTGILNGLGPAWDPALDARLPTRYSPGSPAGKRACRRALCERFDLRPGTAEPVFGVVARLAWQKGLDLVVELGPWLARRGVLAVLGAGEPALERAVQHLCRAFPGRVGAWIGYDEDRSRAVFAGSDVFLMPSRYEPCGLAQMQAMRYGALPVVHATGGLRDTVHHGEDGFVFEVCDLQGLRWACEQSLEAFADRESWAAMMHTAMSRDFGWQASAERYDAVYRSVLGRGV